MATDARRREVYWAAYAADGRRQGRPAGQTAAGGAAPADDRARRPRSIPTSYRRPRDRGSWIRGVLATAGPACPTPARPRSTCGGRTPPNPTRRKSVLPLTARRPAMISGPVMINIWRPGGHDLPAIMSLERAGFAAAEQWSERSWLGELLGGQPQGLDRARASSRSA